jgi:hypothetical protein
LSSDLDALAMDVIMPSQPNELPVEADADLKTVESKLKDESALRAKMVSILVCFNFSMEISLKKINQEVV